MYASLLKKFSGRPTGRVTSRVHTLPAPVGGWNARDSLSAMKPEDAVVLDNIIPDAGRVRIRPGYDRWSTSAMTGDYVETLMEYDPPSGSRVLFAATPSAIYDVTTGAPSSSVGSMTSGRWQHLMMATTGGNFLCCVNGADNYRTYDGSAWTDQDAALTGVASETLINLAIHGSRLWFVQKDTLDAWYLGTQAITGAATKFPLGPLAKKGGYLVAIATWTQDGGSGMDDHWVAVTSKGEVIVYSGTDPAAADTWSLVGVFQIAEPVGRRCMIKVGGDLGIITSTGVALLSQLIGVNRSGQRKVTITNKIAKAFTEAYNVCGSSHGWQIIEFPSQNLVIINVPWIERATSYQFVINVETGAWCRWTGVDALAWSLFGDRLFFGGADGHVYEFGTSEEDNGLAITWIAQSAYNKLASPQNKIITAARALMVATTSYRPGLEIMSDYDPAPPSVQPPPLNSEGGAEWDVADWDTSDWGIATTRRAMWRSVTGQGRTVSAVLTGSARSTFEFFEIDLMYELGNHQ